MREKGEIIPLAPEAGNDRRPKAREQGAPQARRDAVARQDAEGATSGSEALFRATFEQAAVGMAHVALDGRFLRINQRYCDIVGYPREELMGCTFLDVTHPHDRDADLEHVRQILAGEVATYSTEKRSLRKEGGIVWVAFTVSLVSDEAGAPKYLLAVAQDISRHKEAEEALAEKARALARSNQELEQFAYIASHDLQEPLRKIRAFGDRLESTCGGALGDTGRGYLERMLGASKRMQALIEGLLTYSRVTTQAESFALVDLGEVVRAVLTDLEARAEEAGARIELGTLPTTVEAVPTQMRQLFQNLIGNALKFHRPDVPPVVKVHGRVLQDEGTGSDPSAPARRICEIVVQDNGIGFDGKHAARVFGLFQRLRARGEFEGSGVGLAICRRIVERHHGCIKASGIPGQGATFVVTLPLEQPRRGAEPWQSPRVP